MKISTPFRAIVAVTLAASVLGACGSSDDTGADNDSEVAAKPTGAAPKGDPIKLMIVAVKNNPILTQEQQFAAAQARVDSANASGGLGGRPLELVQCDSNLDPNQEQACIDKAITEKVSAIVGSTMMFSDFSKLETAKIPLLANQGLGPTELTSPISYTFGNNVGWYSGIAATVAADGIKTVGISYIDTDAGKFAEGFIDAGLKASGVKTVSYSAHAATAADRATDALTLTKGDPDAVIVTGTAEGVIPIMQAVRQSGFTKPIYTIAPDVNPAGIKALGSAGDGIRVVGRGRFLSDTKNEKVAAYLADVANFAPKGTVEDENGLLGWSGVDTFISVMKDASAFTGADTIDALSTVTTPIEGGGFGPFLGAGTGCMADYPRLLNTQYIVGTLNDGKIVADSDFKSYC